MSQTWPYSKLFLGPCTRQWRGMSEQMKWSKPPLFILLLFIPSPLQVCFLQSGPPLKPLDNIDGRLYWPLINGGDHGQGCASLVKHSCASAPLSDSSDPSSEGPHASHTWLPRVSGSSVLLWWLLDLPECAGLAGRVSQCGGPAGAIPLSTSVWCGEKCASPRDIMYLSLWRRLAFFIEYKILCHKIISHILFSILYF